MCANEANNTGVIAGEEILSTVAATSYAPRRRGALRFVGCLLCGFVVCTPALYAHAEHPLEVQRLTAQGEHFQAITLSHKLARRVSSVELAVATGRSAWALSLPELAHEQFDSALRDLSLTPRQRVPLLFSKAILHFQEGRFEMALVWGSKAIALLEDAPALRARVLSLIGQAEISLERIAAAEQHLTQAHAHAAGVDAPEMAFHLGVAKLKLGKFREAREILQDIPLTHERAAEAIRYLAVVACAERDMKRAGFWLTKGRQEFPDQFLDGWVDYSLMEAAIAEGDIVRVRAVRSDGLSRLPESDHWRVLAEAAAEAFEWETRESETRASLRATPPVASQEVSNE